MSSVPRMQEFKMTESQRAAFLERVLPKGAPREVLTFSVTPTFGPVSLDLLVVSLTVGPIGLHVSLLSVVGVVLAYLLARSLF